MKRLDLIFSERELDAILTALENAGAPGYTVMKHATGRGPETIVSEDMEFSGLGANAHVIVFCDEDIINKTRENIKSILNYYGGVAYVSEATPL
ncbi:P-II family nitrogen regulator [Prochlorococcus marinus]|uniref:P-II family nitrogen regulator n=1 Tax=Prochlorococcus marinus TaxID=1219 RepID=UPI0022B2B8CF|nr:transcriptional regulator [Prochlorococcus marinus]